MALDGLNLALFSGRGLILDLGSTHVVLSSRHRDLVLRQRNRVRLPGNAPAGKAVSKRARSGRPDHNPFPASPKPELISPVRHGRVANSEAMDSLLEGLLHEARGGHWLSWIIKGTTGLVTPPILDDEERLRLEDLAHRHGLTSTRLIDLGQALAGGCGIDPQRPRGQMVIDIGGGKTFIAVYSLGGIVAWHWADVGGEILDQGLADYVERRYQIQLPPEEAERVKIELGSVYPQERPQRTDALGVQTRSGLPQKITLDDSEVRDVLVDGCERLVLAIHHGFKKVPPEMTSDIALDGVILCGGGALLRGLPDFITERTGLPVRLAPDPINASIRGGAGLM